MKRHSIYCISLCLALCVALPAYAEVEEVHTMGGSPSPAQSLFQILMSQLSDLRMHPSERPVETVLETVSESVGGESVTTSSETSIESDDGTVTVSEVSSAVIEQESSVVVSNETIINNENVSDDVPIECPEPDYPTSDIVSPIFGVKLPIIPSEQEVPGEGSLLENPPEPILKKFLRFVLP